MDGFEITELPLISLVYTILGGLAIARIGVHENAGKRRVLLTLVSSLLKLILGRSNVCALRSMDTAVGGASYKQLAPVVIHLRLLRSTSFP